ncbi:MAG: hypothetical protein U1F61_12090 [Opitutaceae bacterium]
MNAFLHVSALAGAWVASCGLLAAQSYRFTTLAGDAGITGTTNGSGSGARFNGPNGLAVDAAGYIYVADRFNHAIRKVSPDGEVTTLAGLPGQFGSADGVGSAARFSGPQALTVDGTGIVFVADFFNQTIRRISPEGVVTTVAGQVAQAGSNDGLGTAARFNSPLGIVVDSAGALFIGDVLNRTVRRMAPNGLVSTVAGQLGVTGHADGVRSAAQFFVLRGLAADAAGQVYLAEWGDDTIRRLSPDGTVVTLAGLAGSPGAADGSGALARFRDPSAVAVDPSGRIFVADSSNHLIRQITPEGVVATIAGAAGVFGSDDGLGANARFLQPAGVAVSRDGILYVADSGNHTLRKGVRIPQLPVVIQSPASRHVPLNTAVTFAVEATGGDLAFQWTKNGEPIPGATASTYAVGSAQASDMGVYVVKVSLPDGSIRSSPALLTVETGGASRLSNLSTRGYVSAGRELAVGFVMRGTGEKSILGRAVGPALVSFGITDALADPVLDLIPLGTSTSLLGNDTWGGGAALVAAFSAVGAFALPADSADAALLARLTPGGYTARTTGRSLELGGIALVEVYDRDTPDTQSRLINLSSLGPTTPDARRLSMGFVIGGDAPKRLLIRAIGPGLERFGVPDFLSNPFLTLRALGQEAPLAVNDDWGGDALSSQAFAAAGAFDLVPGSRDAVLLVRLPPGGYTMDAIGSSSTGGRVLIELYDLDP